MEKSIALLWEGADGSVPQRIEALRRRRGTVEDLSFLCPAEALDACRGQLEGLPVEAIPTSSGPLLEAFVFVSSTLYMPLAAADWLKSSSTEHVYLVGPEGSINRYHEEGAPAVFEAIDHPFAESHVFNRLARPRDYQQAARSYVFFPYGFIYRCLGLGPVNEFGFRIDADLEALARRDPRHKLICCFGGSTVFSVLCLHHQMFPAVLERALNEACRERGSDVHFTVLNFGQNSHVVLNQMLTYELFCSELKPDLVISHDGHNDLMWGQINDPLLVERGITYPTNFEDWASMLYGAQTPSARQEGTPKGMVVNPPHRVVSAYLSRKRQFASMVMAAGSRFVWGLQPLIWAKKGMTEEETNAVRFWVTHPEVGPAVQNLPLLFSMVMKEPVAPGSIEANVYRELESAPPDQTLFGDHIHMRPEGDAVIAAYYSRLISDLVLQ